MSDDAPHGGGPDDEPGTAPWERPRRWTPAPAEPTKVDELLARLGAEETGRRQRRRVEQHDSQTVSATDLIASLQNAGAAEDSEPDGPAVGPTAGTGDDDPEATVATTGADPTPAPGAAADPGEAPTELIILTDLPGDGSADAADVHGPDAVTPAEDPDATTLIPRYAEAAAIRESLTRQAIGTEGAAETALDWGPAGASGERNVPQPPASDTGSTDGSGRHSQRGFLYAGRSIVAVLAALLLIATGFEYTLLRNTDTALAESSIDAVQTDDPNIKTPSRSTITDPTGTDQAVVAPQVYEPENILLLGSDTRAGDNGDSSNSDETTEGVAQSDTLMIAHVSGDRQHITIISIPRDLRVDAPQCKAWDADTMEMSEEDFPISDGERWKITNAYAVGGPACTVKAVQQLTGLKIDRVIGIDFLGFKTMVDALDGIQVNVCGPIDDAELGMVIPTGGEQVVRGDQALNLVRARKVIGDPTGDIGRIRRQQVVLSSLLRQAISAGTLLSPNKLQDFLDAFVNATYTDNVTVDSMLELAKSFGDLDPSKITFYTLPTVPGDDDDLELDPHAEAVFEALLNDHILPGETPSTTTPAPSSSAAPSTTDTSSAATSKTAPTTSSPAADVLTVAPDQVDLEVVNVAGRPGVAGEGMDALNEVGFAITEDDLTLPAEEPVYEDVTVLYAPGNEAAALTVAAAVPGAVLEAQDGLDDRVRLLLGTSWDGSVQAVSVGQSVPVSLVAAVSTTTPGTTAASTDQSAPAASAEGTTEDQPSGAGGSTPATTGPTLGSTDLSSVNAAETLCA